MCLCVFLHTCQVVGIRHGLPPLWVKPHQPLAGTREHSEGADGQFLAAPDWTLRTGWVAKVRGMEAPRGCAPLGDKGPGPWGRTRHVGAGHR